MDEKEKPKRTAVWVVRVKGDSALVEWGDRRGYVPVGAVKDDTVSAVTLKRAVPYGVPWDDLAEGLAAKMHAANIWTTDDLARNARVGFEAARPFKLSLGDLNRFAHKEG